MGARLNTQRAGLQCRADAVRVRHSSNLASRDIRISFEKFFVEFTAPPFTSQAVGRKLFVGGHLSLLEANHSFREGASMRKQIRSIPPALTHGSRQDGVTAHNPKWKHPNALKHGVFSVNPAVLGGDPCEFDALLSAVIDEWQPCDLVQDSCAKISSR
jgi:hypothetical protein